jgi:glycosyltransferase involved in cell wall biosynthesis
MLKGCPRLLVIGEGAMRGDAEQYTRMHGLGGSVRLVGERTDIPDLRATPDIFVLSSRWEGLPYAIIEAMMSSPPVVASYVGGTTELVEDGVAGFLVSPGDP